MATGDSIIVGSLTVNSVSASNITGDIYLTPTLSGSYAGLTSPALSGIPTAPTASLGTNTNQLATTAFVHNQIDNDIATKAPLDSPLFTGTVSASNLVLSGTLLTSAGTSAIPAFSSPTDPDTGIYFPSSNNIGLSVGGTQIVNINSTGIQVIGGRISAQSSNSVLEMVNTSDDVIQVRQYERTGIYNGAPSGAAVIRAYRAGGGAHPGIFLSPSSGGPIGFCINDTECMRIGSNGNVGIGTTNPLAKLSLLGGSSNTISTSNLIVYFRGDAGNGIGFGSLLSAPYGSYIQSGKVTDLSAASYPLILNPLGGNVLIGTTTDNGSGAKLQVTGGITCTYVTPSSHIYVGTTSSSKLFLDGGYTVHMRSSINGGGGGALQIYASAEETVGIYLPSNGNSWTAISDERAKNIIEPITNGVNKVKALRAVIGSYIDDESNIKHPFLIAQDVLNVLPEAVDTINPDKLGLAYTDVIPLLVAAIKELSERIELLENK